LVIKVKQLKPELQKLVGFKGSRTLLRKRLKAIKVGQGELARYLREKWARMVANRKRPASFPRWPCVYSMIILGSTNAVSEDLVSQFEALAAEDVIAFRENRPIANRFKRRPSVWPTIKPSTHDPDTQRLTSMKIYLLNDPRKNTERFLIMVCRTMTARYRFELEPPVPPKLPRGTLPPSCPFEGITPDSVFAHAAV
jgi:hypothetical protein